MSRLIEAIPDDLALRCLAYVPLNYHPNLELVSRSWRAAIRSAHLFNVRKEIKSSENLLCVCTYDPENIWQVYSPTCDRWLTLPNLPSNIRHIASFGAVTIGRKLFVLGGGKSHLIVDGGRVIIDGVWTNDVWSYDFVERKWAQRASMHIPRAMFACCVLDGNIIVAGGVTNGQTSLSKAEIYNPDNDVWTALPNLHWTHYSACSGLVLEDKVHLFHKYVETVQVLESVELGWVVKERDWPQGPMAVIEDVPYVMSERVVFKQEGETWKKVASVPEFNSWSAITMTSLSKEVLILGRRRRRWDRQMDVHTLTVGNVPPTWRKLAPLSTGGIIIACKQLTI